MRGYSCKRQVVPRLEAAKANLVPRYNKGHFMEAHLKINAFKIAPNQYKMADSIENFASKDSKNVHFAYNKQKRTSLFEEKAKAMAYIPGPSVYKTQVKEKILGNTR